MIKRLVSHVLKRMYSGWSTAVNKLNIQLLRDQVMLQSSFCCLHVHSLLLIISHNTLFKIILYIF